MRVIGTAGHVDHGKSTLVQALTGTHPDRLKEEKERGMTIDLGFAWLDLPGGERVGIVDVPGHIDFIKNMLAGVGGIDAALFVVAADEGVMPQTVEHLAILNLLHASGGVIALTKVDLLDDADWLALVTDDVRQAVAGTCLDGAPIVPVSARTGAGLPELVAALTTVLQQSPPRRDLGRPRLPVDRVFAVAGFGTVVTGTLSDGAFYLGQEVEVSPSGLKARIRGLQSHHDRVDVAVPGSRVAVNLSGVDMAQVRRGEVVALPGQLPATTLVDAQLDVLPDAPGPLKHNVWLDFFSGTAEVAARLRLLDGEAIAPGEAGWVQLALSGPVAVRRGDRFIVRQPSPSRTVGGGVIVNPAPGRRHRRGQPAVIAQLEQRLRGTPADLLLATLQQQEPVSVGALVVASHMEPTAARAAFAKLQASGQLRLLGQSSAGGQIPDAAIVFSQTGWLALQARCRHILGEYHRQHPLRAGMPREELKSRLQPRGTNWPARLFNDIAALLVAGGVMVADDAVFRLPDHAVRFTAEQQAKADALLAAFRQQPTAAPSWSEATAQVGPEVLQALVEQAQLVRISDDVLLLAATYAEMVTAVKEHIRQHGSITVAQLRDRFNTSRKYALALLEHLDEQRVTRRVGDARVRR